LKAISVYGTDSRGFLPYGKIFRRLYAISKKTRLWSQIFLQGMGYGNSAKSVIIPYDFNFSSQGIRIYKKWI